MFLDNISHIYCLYSLDNDKDLFCYKNTNVSYHKYDLNSVFKDKSYFRNVLMYECIIDAYNNKYENICFLYPDVKILETECDFTFYNIFCLNPFDVNNDCIIINKIIIDYIYSLGEQDFSNYKWKENLFNYLDSNFKIYYPDKNYVKHKIDYVITYVNNNDPNWVKQYNETFGILPTNSIRFNDYGTLESLINRVRKYCNFIDDIYIIVSNKSQLSNEVMNLDIKVVEHKEIIPNQFLPTFNSCTIEMFLGNIKGLSEYFIYGNDDMFFINSCTEDLFFDNGKILVDLMNNNNNDCIYSNQVKNTFKSLLNEFTFDYFKSIKMSKTIKNLKHTPHPCIKSSALHILNYHKDKIYNSISLTRESKNFNQYIYTFYEYFTNNSINIKKSHNIYLSLSDINNSTIKKLNNHIKFICINDNVHDKNIFNIKIEILKNILQIEKYIVSLTSYPARIQYVNNVLLSLVNQNVHNDLYKICLVLSKDEFTYNDLPKDLINTIESYKNIEILWDNGNIKSHKKIIPVLEKYKDVNLLICDDDVLRPNNWLSTFINDHEKYPNDIIFSNGKQYLNTNLKLCNYYNIGTKCRAGIIYDSTNTITGTLRPMNGFGGVLYPVNTFTDKLFFNRKLFMELSPTSDEMWQYCFNIMDDKQFRTCSTFFDYTNYVIDESQKLDTCLYKVNDSNYQKILNNLINIFPKFKENLLKRTQLSNSCICTITNDDFVEGCITMIYSFLKNNKWFNNDIVILYSDNYSPLSNKSKNKISKLYKNIKYKHIDDSIYDKLVDYSGIPTKFIPPLIKFEIFNLTEYNKVLYIDSDALVINDIYELFIDNTDICFFPHESFHVNSLITLEDLHNNRERINNGIILLNNNGISFNNYFNLLYNLNSYNTSDIFYHGTPDQDIMEKTFLTNINDINIKIFPNVYNEIKRKYVNKDKLNGNEKIIHYVMKKPWNSNEPEYEFINSIWHKYHNEIINNDNV